MRFDDGRTRHGLSVSASGHKRTCRNCGNRLVPFRCYSDFNGKRPGPSITLSTICRCTAVNVPLRSCISSTIRARHSLSDVSAALFFMLSSLSALRNCLSHFARRARTPSRTRFECLPSSARTSLRNASMRLSICLGGSKAGLSVPQREAASYLCPQARSQYRELRRACTMLYVRPKFYRSTTHIAGECAVAAFEMTCARVSDLAAYKKRCVPDFRGDRPAAPCAFEWERPPAVL